MAAMGLSACSEAVLDAIGDMKEDFYELAKKSECKSSIYKYNGKSEYESGYGIVIFCY